MIRLALIFQSSKNFTFYFSEVGVIDLWRIIAQVFESLCFGSLLHFVPSIFNILPFLMTVIIIITFVFRFYENFADDRLPLEDSAGIY